MTEQTRKAAHELLAAYTSRVERGLRAEDEVQAFCLLYLAETIRQQGENIRSTLLEIRDSIERGG